MSLKMNDKSLGITIKNADIRIDYLVINPGTPVINRAPSTYIDSIDPETGENITTEVQGEIISVEKRYNVNLFLQYQNEDKEAVYFRECISLNGLSEDELNLPSFYTKMKELEKFSNAKDA